MIDTDFDTAVRDAGGEFDASTSQNPAQREVLAYARNVLAAIGQSDLYCGLIRNSQFNARAFRFNNRDFIGLHSGAVRVLMCSSFALLSDRKVFPDIGAADDEANDGSFASGFGDLTVASQPKCPQRQFFARAVFQFANAFIFCHEYGHHWAGHVDFVTKSNALSHFYEAPCEAPYLEFNPTTQQAIELDADRAAVSMYVCSLLDLVESFPRRLEAFRAWFTAMFLVYYLMAEASNSIGMSSGNIHPHPSVRMMFVIPHACHEISQRLPPAATNIERVAMSSLFDVQNTWVAIRAPGYSKQLAASVSKDAKIVLFRLHEELATFHQQGISRCVYPTPDPADLED